jgi:hypothetical protein
MLSKGLATLLVLLAANAPLSMSAGHSSGYCDALNDICFQGYTDTRLDITFGLALPQDAVSGTEVSESSEFIAQLIAPARYGWTAISLGGRMTDSLLITFWPDNDKVIVGPRWTPRYQMPKHYHGPKITLLPDSNVNSTHIKATFRCQNCTSWQGGSLGSGNLNSLQGMAYATSTTRPVNDPANISSGMHAHNDYGYFKLDLGNAHMANYDHHLSLLEQPETHAWPRLP